MTVAGGVLVHLALTAAPGIAVSLYALRKGVRSHAIVLSVALAISGLSAYAAFLAYYADPVIGAIWDIFALLASIAVGAWCLRDPGLEQSALRPFAVPLLLWMLGTGFVTFLGFLHGGTNQAISMSALRFSGQLPSDNDIPRYFSEWFAAHGHAGPPPEYPGGWLMSDRPPLQVGYVLSQHAFFDTTSSLHYEVLCVGLQELWVVGMWAVLTAAGLRARTRALAMAAAMISDVAIVHGFFVWPKLLAAAFLLAALALVISPDWPRLRKDPRVAALLGCLLALAMLAHGSSVFGIVPLLFLATLRGLPGRRWVGVALLAAVTLYAPWMAYQHFADPPGDRLLKWQLGGDLEVNSEGTLAAIANGYGKAGVSGTLANKERNFEEIIGFPRLKNSLEAGVDELDAGHPGQALEQVRELRFFSLLPFVGIFLVGPVAMLARRRRNRAEDEWGFALTGFAFVGIACVVWGLVLFGAPDSTTTIHVGSLAVPLIAVCACVAGLHSVMPRLALLVVAVNTLATLILYTPSLQPPPGSTYSPVMAILVAVSLAALLTVLFRSQRRPSWSISAHAARAPRNRRG